MKAKELIEHLSKRPDAEVVISAPFPSKTNEYGLQMEQRIESVNIFPCFWYCKGEEHQPITITIKP